MLQYLTGLDKETGRNERKVVLQTTDSQSFEIEIDIETAKQEIIKAVSAFDLGKAIIDYRESISNLKNHF